MDASAGSTDIQGLCLKIWRHPMNVTIWTRLFLTLILMTPAPFITSPPSAHAQSSPGSGPDGPPAANSRGIAKPKKSRADVSTPNLQPSDIPGQTGAPRQRTQALEERLRNGRMEQPVAQGQISDRLERLHEGSVERLPQDTPTDPSAK